jgi:hypothetical protein
VGWQNLIQGRAAGAGRRGTAGDEGLRPPQIGALHCIGAHWSIHRSPATIVMPTGTGKTETMLASLAALIRGPLVVAVPSDILRSQTARKFMAFGLLRKMGVLAADAPNPIVGVITKRPKSVADLKLFECCNVVVGTMIRRFARDVLAALKAHRVKRVPVLEQRTQGKFQCFRIRTSPHLAALPVTHCARLATGPRGDHTMRFGLCLCRLSNRTLEIRRTTLPITLLDQ